MRIKSLSISNLRSIKSAKVDFDNYNCLVGANGAGKSTVLFALNILFRETQRSSTDVAFLSAEDFHNQDTSTAVEVTATFADLSEDAKKDFVDYVRQGQLVLSAVAKFDATTGRAEVKQYGQRLGMPAFMHFFELHGNGSKVEELRAEYTTLSKQFIELPPASTKDRMREALKAYEAGRPEECRLIPSEDQFYGVSKGSNRLQRHVQWVYVPAILDASEEQLESKDTALGKLLGRTVRAKVNFQSAVKDLVADARAKYAEILSDHQSALDGISSALRDRLAQWAHPDASVRLTWQQEPAKAVDVREPFAKIIAGEGTFEGEIARFGHGFQRSYLLALLQELAASNDDSAPTLILGCEEPELYQHPPQARHLSQVLWNLSSGNSQVVVTTHSPYFVSGDNFENVRLLRRDQGSRASSVEHLTHSQISDRFAHATGEALVAPSASMAKVHQMLQPHLSEIFFTNRLVLVEGLEDVAYLNAWLSISDRMSEFRRIGCHIVPVNGKSELIRPLVIAQGLKIPTYVVFDSDVDKIEKNEHRIRHERDNRALLRLLGGDEATLFPTVSTWGVAFATWPKDLGSVIDSELGNSLGDAQYEAIKNAAHASYGNDGGLKKNTLCIYAKMSRAFEAGGRSATLDKLCDEILSFGANTAVASDSPAMAVETTPQG